MMRSASSLAPGTLGPSRAPVGDPLPASPSILGMAHLRIDSPQSTPAGYQFYLEQQDLDKLCADRPLRTREIHGPNDFYGQASVIKRYVGLPQWYSLKVVLEHSPVMHDRMWQLDRNRLLPLNFSSSPERAKVAQECSGRRSFSIGFGFLYAKQLVDEAFAGRSPAEPKGTLVFPFKSTQWVETRFDHADYAERIAKLSEAMKPIVVCMYWKDVLRGAHRPYQHKGFPVVSAGHMFDANFFFRLYDICRQFRYAVSNEFGTQLFLSVASGCRFFYLESSHITREIPPALRKDYVRDEPGFQRTQHISKRLFAEPTDQITPDQRAFVDGVLGTQSLRSRADLHRLILRAEWWDKFRATRIIQASGRVSWNLPCWYQRRLAHIARMGRSIKKRIRAATPSG